MSTKNFSDAEIQAYLIDKADLDGFFITEGAGIDGGLISYVDRKGAAWTLMEDDDSLVEVCLDFLRNRGNKVFSDVASEDAFVEELQKKYAASST